MMAGAAVKQAAGKVKGALTGGVTTKPRNVARERGGNPLERRSGVETR